MVRFLQTANNLPVLTVGQNGVLNVPYDATDTLDEQLTSECNIQGQDVCVHRAVYRSIVTLPQTPGGYTIVYQRCCRNQTLQNIVAPLNTGAVFSVQISDVALAVCNSSPRYEDWPLFMSVLINLLVMIIVPLTTMVMNFSTICVRLLNRVIQLKAGFIHHHRHHLMRWSGHRV